MTSNFSAETQKGPAVITSVTKSGGQQFHGSGFFYARNYVLNANDALNNAQNPIVERPANAYYYPGFTFGGPVIIPGTRFNKSRQKLFFFTGYEYFHQVLDTGLLRATVPTAGEINGDFSDAELAKEGPNAGARKFPAAWGTQVPQSAIDPNMVALMKLYPAANADPNGNKAVLTTFSPRFSIRTTCNGRAAWTTTSATTLRSSSATTCSARRSNSRLDCGGGRQIRSLIQRRWKARISPTQSLAPSPTFLVQP